MVYIIYRAAGSREVLTPGETGRSKKMINASQRQLFAEWIAAERGDEDDPDEIAYYAEQIETTLDPFDRYDGSQWRECGPITDEEIGGIPVRLCESVQAVKGSQRVDVYVADFGTARAIYQI